MAQTYGYARCSTKEQNEDRQLIAMRDFGVAEGNIFLDKQSGKDFHRQAYRRLLKKLKPGDTLALCETCSLKQCGERAKINHYS